MDLPNLLNKLKTHQEEIKRFIAIEISPTVVKSAVWYVHGHTTRVETTGSIQSWETEETDDLIQAIDASLSSALSGIEPEPNQVIFGLPETWVGEDAIAQNKKPVLKSICTALGLKPVGFVVSTEAIIHFIRETEGGPPSAILIKVENDQVVVSIIHLGVLEGAQVVGRSGDICADVEEGLARFPKKDDIPSRMIIYDSKENIEELKQQLISYDWQSKLPFLHFPKIESLAKDISIKAIAIAGGAEVAQSLGLVDQSDKKEVEVSDLEKDIKAEKDPSPIVDKDLIQEKNKIEEESIADDSPPDMASEFGFTTIEVKPDTKLKQKESTAREKGIDAKTTTLNAPTPPTQTKDKLEEKKDDTKKVDLDEGSAKTLELIPVDKSTLKKDSKPQQKDRINESSQTEKISIIDKIKKIFKKPKIKLPQIKTPSKLKIPSLIIIGLILLSLFIVAGGIAYWVLPTATVTVFVKPNEISKELTFSLDSSLSELDLEKSIIPATVETVTATGNNQTPTTGAKTVGDRATGTVAIYNRTSSPKTLSAGTNLAYENLIFTLNEDVNIASASSTENADFSITVQPSKTEATVTAIDIGSQYNLSVDTQFSVANFSSESFIAKAVTDFTGGSSREIQAVSQSDIDLLKEDLINQLRQQTTDELKAKSNHNKDVIFTDDYEISDQSYSADVGDEADSINLEMTVTQTAYQYQITDISLIAQKVMLENIPDGFALQADATVVEVLETNIDEDDSITIKAKTTLKLMPIIDTQQIARTIQGKYPPLTESYFKSLPNFVRTETQITPALPSRLNTFPRKVENIQVEVKSIP